MGGEIKVLWDAHFPVGQRLDERGRNVRLIA